MHKIKTFSKGDADANQWLQKAEEALAAQNLQLQVLAMSHSELVTVILYKEVAAPAA